MTAALVVETCDLTKRYGGQTAVDWLNLRVAAGGITGFLGRNGAGKSSTFKMLLGMVRPTGGTGTVLGYRIADPEESRTMREHVAYVAEDKQTYAYMTVEQMIRFARSFYADWQPDAEKRLLARYRPAAAPPRRRVKALSKGMRTKLALLLALARRPRLLILDEPTEGLDRSRRRNCCRLSLLPPPREPRCSARPIRSPTWSGSPIASDPRRRPSAGRTGARRSA